MSGASAFLYFSRIPTQPAEERQSEYGSQSAIQADGHQAAQRNDDDQDQRDLRDEREPRHPQLEAVPPIRNPIHVNTLSFDRNGPDSVWIGRVSILAG